MRTRTLSEIIQDTIAIYKERIIVLVVLGVIGIVGAIVAGLIAVAGGAGAIMGMMMNPEAAAGLGVGALIVVLLAGLVMVCASTASNAAIIYAVDVHVRGSVPDIAASLQAILPRIVVILLSQIVVAAAVTAVWIVATVLGLIVDVLLFITIPLAIVVAIYLGVRWGFVVQAVVIDGADVIGAINRSAALVQGQWWRVLGIGLVIGVALLLVNAAVGAVLGNAAFIVQLVLSPVLPIAQTLLYYDLRVRKEAPPAAPMAPPAPAI